MPEFEDSHRFRDLVQAFEEHQRLARLLNAFAEASVQEVKLLLGSENPYLQDMPLATAMRTVSLPGDEIITFALVGPLRVNYVRLLGGLSWWSDEINRRIPRPV
jgi:heat-inducible transcriptional repressor